jgi:hypothetical protein
MMTDTETQPDVKPMMNTKGYLARFPALPDESEIAYVQSPSHYYPVSGNILLYVHRGLE